MDLKQEVELIHEEILKQSKKQNFVAGARFGWFKFSKPTNLSEACSGKLIILGEKEEDGRFFLSSIDSFSQVNDIAKVSSKLRTPFLLCVRLVSLTYPSVGAQEELVLCYDHFDDILKHWIGKNPHEPFIADEEVLNAWWREQIRNILDTLAYMHEQRVFHGNMSGDSSYVVTKNTIHLINASIDGLEKDEDELKLLARNDLQGLKDILKQYVQSDYRSTDWEDFIDLFDVATVWQLRKHPVLMDANTRFKYFRSISSYILYEMDPDECGILSSVLVSHVPPGNSGNSYLKFENWNTKITSGSVLDDIYNHNCAFYSHHSANNLLEYVVKVFDHYNERARARKLVSTVDESADKATIERLINTAYPGFLSYVHGILVRCFPTFSISSE